MSLEGEEAGAATSVPSDARALVAVDLGAESCRVSLLRWIDGRPRVEVVHRFANGPVTAPDGTLRWPLDAIVDGVESGLRMCAERAPEGVRSIAVDGWAVDYVRIGSDGQPLALPFCYRDERTAQAERVLHERIAPERLRAITGLQLQRLNTVYQQVADRLAGAPAGEFWLNLPEYLMYRWGAPPVAEYTMATHTQMVDARTRTWSEEILEAAGVAAETMPRIVQPGTKLGRMRGPLASLGAFRETELIAPACHDTASAIAGIAAEGEDDWGYVSSGTWSLVGTPLKEPCLRVEANAEGFTNLGGVAGTVCFHANLNGMWLLKQCMDAWVEQGRVWEIAELVREAENVAPPAVLLDGDDPELQRVGGMPERIRRQMEGRGVRDVDTSVASAPAVASLIFHSLAQRYSEAFARVQEHAGKRLRRVFVVGGGSRNGFLCRLTAARTGLEVQAGSAESSTLGNFALQLAAFEADADDAAFGPAVRGWVRKLEA